MSLWGPRVSCITLTLTPLYLSAVEVSEGDGREKVTKVGWVGVEKQSSRLGARDNNTKAER